MNDRTLSLAVIIVLILCVLGAIDAWPTESAESQEHKSWIFILNSYDKPIVARVEWQNHNVKVISPFRPFHIYVGEINPKPSADRLVSIDVSNYPIGSIFRVTATYRFESEEVFNMALQKKTANAVMFYFIGGRSE